MRDHVPSGLRIGLRLVQNDFLLTQLALNVHFVDLTSFVRFSA